MRDRHLVLELDGVRLRDSRGELQDLTLLQRRLDSSAAERRVSVAGAPVPAGSYDAVVLSISGAAIETGGRRTPVAIRADPETSLESGEEQVWDVLEVEVPIRVRIRQNDAASIFLDWDADASVDEGGGLRPVFTVAPEARQVQLGRMYVTDGATGLLLSVDRASGDVLATVGVGADPRDLALSLDLRRMFVANARDGSLSIVDLRQNLVTSTIPIQIGAGTWDVAVTEPDGTVLATNRSLDSVSFFDSTLATKLAQVTVGRGPTRLAVANRLNRAYVVNSLSDEVSVLDLNSRSLVGTLKVESRPIDVVVDRRERELFVAHETSQNLLVVDAVTLAVVDSIFVGGDATALLADRRRDRVYLARDHPPELAIVDRGLSAVVRRIPLSGAVLSLAQPIEGAIVYGASPELGGVIPIDVLAAAEGAVIPCGQRPTSVAFVD